MCLYLCNIFHVPSIPYMLGVFELGGRRFVSFFSGVVAMANGV